MRLAAAALLAVATLASGCGARDVPTASVNDTIAAFARHGIALKAVRLGENECPNDTGATLVIDCYTITFGKGPFPKTVLTPSARLSTRVAVYRYESADEVQQFVDDGKRLSILSRANVVVMCLDCSERLRNQIRSALNDL